MSAQETDAPLWTPPTDPEPEPSLLGFQRGVAERHGIDPTDYHPLWQWSVDDLAGFWAEVWDWFRLDEHATPYDTVLDGEQMPGGTRWFPGAELSFASYLLAQGDPDQEAVIGVCESGERTSLTRAELRHQALSFARTLTELGVGAGDRVVGYLPNTPEGVAALLGAASVGAVWSGVGQDYAPGAVVDRFAQLEPTVLVVADGHHWGGKVVDRRPALAEIREGLPTVQHVVLVDHVGLDTPEGVISWDDVVAQGPGDVEPVAVPFEHPLWVLYSSGTTGLPKGLVHSHGGVLLEQLKQLQLQFDITGEDRFFWYTSPSWVMWNIQVCALATGAAVVAFDGSPVAPTPDRVWEVAAEEKVTFLGISPGYLVASEGAGLRPGEQHDLSALQSMGSTGSPLSPHSHRWVQEAVTPAPLWSLSGGTDIASGFVGGAPTLPIWAGEISAPCLGVALDAWDEEGRPVREDVGEMVITRPMPSMPLGLWGDEGHERYRDAYFSTYPGAWRQGDWITITDRGSVIIHGRSDSTINRNGIRMGSADIYAAVETMPEVTEALVIGAEQEDGSYWMPLFVVLADDRELDEELTTRLRTAIREKASPRHVPDEIVQVRGVPHTKTGKKLEVPVKRILQGMDATKVANPETLDDPSLLGEFASIRSQRYPS